MNSVMLQAVKRQKDRPDIHRPIVKLKKGCAFDQDTLLSISEMVSDLKEHCPRITRPKLARLIGVSVTTISELPNFDDDEDDVENNEISTANELAALQFHHDRYHDDRPFIVMGRPADFDEWSNVPALFTAPSLRDPYRVADQLHTINRPITLAKTPFNVAA